MECPLDDKIRKEIKEIFSDNEEMKNFVLDLYNISGHGKRRKIATKHLKNIGKMPLYRGKYTLEKLKKIASKYQFRSEFKKHDFKAYVAASRRGFLDEVCSHMERKFKEYTYEECKEFAKNSHFSKFETSRAADVARENGWYDELV